MSTDLPQLPHVVIGIPCLMVGGTEMQTLMLIKVLRTRNVSRQSSVVSCRKTEVSSQRSEPGDEMACRITVLCYFEHDGGMVEEFRKAGAEVLLLNLHRSISPVALVLKLRAAFSGLQPDIVHVQYMAPGLLSIIAARLAGIGNIVATVHQPANPYGMLPRLFLRVGARLCRSFVCVSEAAERSWFGAARANRNAERGTRSVGTGKDGMWERGNPPSSSHLTIHNAVDIQAVDRILASVDRNRLRRELGLEGAVIVGTVARLSPEKGVDILVKAFVSVYRRFPAARLLIVGDGPERASLTLLAKESGLDGHVAWVGSQQWDKTIEHLSLMDVVAIPSRYEGFGLTAIEAMACGKPVVASGLDSLSEVIGTEVPGSLVPKGDVEALSNSMAAFVADPDRRLAAGRTGRERVALHFGFDLFSNRWISLYRSLFD